MEFYKESELYKEILIKVLETHKAVVTFPDLTISANEIVESVCYKALCDIRDIIRDDELSDSECFEKIEAIVDKLESIGSSGGFRHDF